MNDVKNTNKKSTVRCGHVAIIGRANVGKSTLLNRLIGQKLSITTRKPQTTRHHLIGIKNTDSAQIIYIDTPGIQKSPKTAINRYMNREALNVIDGVDVLVFMIEAMKWTEEDKMVLQKISHVSTDVILVVNKVDKINDKKKLLPFIEDLKQSLECSHIIPMSALSIDDVESLESKITDNLPIAEKIYGDDQITNRGSRFFAAEFIREKLTQKLGDELPYQSTVTIDSFKEKKKILHIHATIWVERSGQKAIIIGKNGAILKSVGEQSRKDMETMFGQKVFLETWVKVKGKWTDDEKALRQFEYDV